MLPEKKTKTNIGVGIGFTPNWPHSLCLGLARVGPL